MEEHPALLKQFQQENWGCLQRWIRVTSYALANLWMFKGFGTVGKNCQLVYSSLQFTLMAFNTD